MIKVMTLALLMVFAGVAYAEIIVPGSCVVVRLGGGSPTPDCACKIFKSTGNIAQDAYNIAYGYAQTADMYGPCMSRDCRDYRPDHIPYSPCYDYSRGFWSTR